VLGGPSPLKTRAAGVSVASNACLIVIKLAAGVFTGDHGRSHPPGHHPPAGRQPLPADELAALHEVLDSFVGDRVVGFHDLRARHVGSHHQVDLHLQFAEGTSLERGHYISHQLQAAIADRLPETTNLIHLEPEDRVRPDRFEDAGSVASLRDMARD
jgi:divalent metal cation (Fe/Co/Zn/Cd) transporter